MKLRTLCHDILRVVEPIGKTEMDVRAKSNTRFELIKLKKSFTEELNRAIRDLDIR